MTPTGGGTGSAVSTVLLVEDDPLIASFLTKGLRAQRVDVEWVDTGAGALARLAGGGAAVVLLDLGLPDSDGLDVLREVRARGLDVPVIVITARTDPQDRVTANALGIASFVRKPFALHELLAAVRACLPERTSLD